MRWRTSPGGDLQVRARRSTPARAERERPAVSLVRRTLVVAEERGMPIDQQLLSFPFPQGPAFGPPPEFARLRAEDPIARVVLPTGDQAWLVTRYADVRRILLDPVFSRAAAEAPGAPRMGNTSPGPRTILGLDPPDHTRLRKLVTQAFTPRRVEGLRGSTERLADRLLKVVLVAPPPVDLMATYALALPITVIFDLLGIEPEDRDRLHAWADVIFSLSAYPREEVVAARRNLASSVAAMVERRRREPIGDLISALVAARDVDRHLDEEELVDLVLVLLTVGHISTANTLGNALFLLLHQPERLDLLRARPELIPGAVEELLRYNPFTLSGTHLRVARKEVELDGVTMRAGDAVIAALGSANHDPTVFDDPDRLDLLRSGNPHLAFGLGVHYCLGAQLARMELQVALTALIRRLPLTLRLALPAEWLVWRTGLTARSPVTLPVVW